MVPIHLAPAPDGCNVHAVRLPDFIETNIELIVREWVSFARSIWPGEEASRLVLRDHAKEMVLAVARDMRSFQTDTQQSDKSKGLGGGGETQRGINSERVDTASHIHALSRVSSGFDLHSLVAEYRALRASVIQLWLESEPDAGAFDLQDITRFNEGIDQLLVESITCYGNSIEASRQCFLGILGHDLRNPLAAAIMVADMIADSTALDARFGALAGTLKSSLTAMNHLIVDLIDFSGTRLGVKMEVFPKSMSMLGLCQEVITEMRAAHPTRIFVLDTCEGEFTGLWDGARLRQMISNLLVNAVQHGFTSTPVTLTLSADSRSVMLDFHNQGKEIPEEALRVIFEHLKRHHPGESLTPRGSFGLGLFIAHEVATAHGGSVEVRSAEEQTVFSVTLPRGMPLVA